MDLWLESTVLVIVSIITLLVVYSALRNKTKIVSHFRPHNGESAVVTRFASGAVEYRFKEGTDLVSGYKIEIRFQEKPPLQNLISSKTATYLPKETIILSVPGAYLVQLVQGEVSMGIKTASLLRSFVVVIGNNWPEPVDMFQEPN